MKEDNYNTCISFVSQFELTIWCRLTNEKNVYEMIEFSFDVMILGLFENNSLDNILLKIGMFQIKMKWRYVDWNLNDIYFYLFCFLWPFSSSLCLTSLLGKIQYNDISDDSQFTLPHIILGF